MNRSQLIERALRSMGAVEVAGTVTTATTTSVTDSSIANKYSANKFKNYELFITRSTDSLAPQSEHRKVTGSSRTAGSFTVGTAFSVAPIGDSYSAFKMPLPIEVLTNLTEDALDYFGKSFVREDTSLSVASSTLVYTLPIATKGFRPIDIHLRDANGFREDAPNWEVTPTAGGSTNSLRFFSQPTESRTIVIRYLVEHGMPSSYSDIIDESVPDVLAISSLVYHAFQNIQRPRNRERDRINTAEAKSRLDQTEAKNPIELPPFISRGIRINRYN